MLLRKGGNRAPTGLRRESIRVDIICVICVNAIVGAIGKRATMEAPPSFAPIPRIRCIVEPRHPFEKVPVPETATGPAPPDTGPGRGREKPGDRESRGDSRAGPPSRGTRLRTGTAQPGWRGSAMQRSGHGSRYRRKRRGPQGRPPPYTRHRRTRRRRKPAFATMAADGTTTIGATCS